MEIQTRDNGHILRRGIHVSLLLIPIVYYGYGTKIAAWIGLPLLQLVIILISIIILLELLRLWRGWVIYGQRRYEAKQISAFTWGAVAIAIVLLLAPPIGYKGAAIGAPLIVSLALGDPALGEARHLGFSSWVTLLIGTVVISLVWVLAVIYLGTPAWLLPIVILVTLAAEWPRLPWLDDNAMMLLVPLFVILGIAYFIPI